MYGGISPLHYGCLSDYPKLFQHLWINVVVCNETSQGLYQISWRTSWALIIKVHFQILQIKCISTHADMACETCVHSQSKPFSCTISTWTSMCIERIITWWQRQARSMKFTKILPSNHMSDCLRRFYHLYSIQKLHIFYVNLYKLTEIKNSVFWDIPCSPLKVNQCFKGTLHLHLQGNNKLSKKSAELHLPLTSTWAFAWRILWSWRWKQHVTLKYQMTFNGLHDVISEKIIMTIAMRTSNLTDSCQIKIHIPLALNFQLSAGIIT
jgi:hypothetical protein